MADTATNLAIAVAVLYVAVVLMAARFLRPRGVLYVALGWVALTILSFYLTPSGRADADRDHEHVHKHLGDRVDDLPRLQSQSAEAALHERAKLLDLSRNAIMSRDMNYADLILEPWGRGAIWMEKG